MRWCPWFLVSSKIACHAKFRFVNKARSKFLRYPPFHINRSIGYAFAYGGADSSKKGFIGNSGFFLSGFSTGGELIGWFFQFAFAATAATIGKTSPACCDHVSVMHFEI
jgi:hypothetical protein